MQKVKCFLPNASDEINGIAFRPCGDGGVESAEALEDDVAAQFDGITGYVLVPVSAPPTEPKTAPAAPKRARAAG